MTTTPMTYRRLGRSGLRVSTLSLGSWVTYHNQVDTQSAAEIMAAAFDAGINFFDNAEVYAAGRSEEVMGAAIRQLAWPRLNYVVSTKFFWGLAGQADGINRKNTLNRKYLMQAIDGSLQRMGLDFIDLIYCHRPDPHTPIEETVRAMSDIITQGKALYWGTSEWSASDIHAAWHLADRHGWHKPVMEQPEYNLFHRQRVEKNNAVSQLMPIAEELGASLAQLALAWVAKNPRVSTVITGASKLSQLQQNLGALAVIDKLTPELMARIEAMTQPLAD